jgi:hypothetical protein
MMRSRTLGVVSLLALILLLLVLGVRADHDRAGAAEATPLEPDVTLNLRVTGKRVGNGAQVTIKGTFRGRAVAGRRTYRLLPTGRAIATHRHGTATAQRARIERVFVDVRSDSDYLRVVGSGPLVGGPAITGPGGSCGGITFRFTVRPKRGTAVLRWACRRAGADRSRPIHLDVLGPPRDTIVSRYTIVRQPCSPQPAAADVVGGVAETC